MHNNRNTEIHEVTIEKDVYEGNGLGFIDKKAVFVPFASKGDTVSGSLHKKGSVNFMYDFTLIKGAPGRVNPPCPHYGICGGCSYQHLEYEDELEKKKSIIYDVLARIAKVETAPVTVFSANRFYYRSHATFIADGENFGFHRYRSHRLRPLDSKGCMICDKSVNDRILKQVPFTGKMKISSSYNKITHTDRENGFVSERCDGIYYRHRVEDFFQANIYLREIMLQKVTFSAAPASADRVCDLGCGCGFFSLHIARRCGFVTGIDSSESSVRSAEENAVLNRIKNVKFHTAEMKDAVLEGFDIIITDPPRAGLDRKCIKSINSSKASRLIYISCNPATWARDIPLLMSGGFSIAEISLFDMFPCTYHIETVTLFVR